MNRLATSISMVILAAGLTVGCGSGGGTKSSAEEAITSAQAAMDKVNGVGYLWRDTGKILDQAKAARDKGDSAKAVALAEKAESQAKEAYAQYQRYYSSAGPRF